MSMLTSLAKAQALEAGRAVLIATRRQVHISDRPLVFLPLMLAGEANAPLACLIGDSPDHPRLLVVPQPRNRDLRFAFAAQLGEVVLDYVYSFTTSMETVAGKNVYCDAPQLLVANAAGIAFTRLLGRLTRLRRTTGPGAVPEPVPLLGRWLTHFAERTEYPGAASMLALTKTLTAHWATGQSALEDEHLAALMAWIDPPDTMTGAEAALAAEDPAEHPPAGPATDPEFDNQVLAPLMREYDQASDGEARASTAAKLEHALLGQLQPNWRLMWRAVQLLRALPEGRTVPQRWDEERRVFTRQVEYWRDGGLPQPRLDHAVAAARRLTWLEAVQQELAVDLAMDDPLVMADFRLAGEAFAGEVVDSDPTRTVRSGSRRALRPLIRVRTSDPIRIEPEMVVQAAQRPGQKGKVVDISWIGGTAYREVILELSGGMGRTLTPAPGSVPAVGERLCYTTLAKDSAQFAHFPSVEETPWTHGGPPKGYQTVEEDLDAATEDWS